MIHHNGGGGKVEGGMLICNTLSDLGVLFMVHYLYASEFVFLSFYSCEIGVWVCFC